QQQRSRQDAIQHLRKQLRHRASARGYGLTALEAMTMGAVTSENPSQRMSQAETNSQAAPNSQADANSQAETSPLPDVKTLNRIQQGVGRSAAVIEPAISARPTGLQPLDQRLPHGGVPIGAITEIMTDQPGSGEIAFTLRLASAIIDTKQTAGIIIVDGYGDFYPPAVQACGLRMADIAVVRPREGHLRIRSSKDQNRQADRPVPNPKRLTRYARMSGPTTRWDRNEQARWAVDQALRCPAAQVVIGFLDDWHARYARRFQLAARQSGTIGILVRGRSTSHRSFAALRLRIDARVDPEIKRMAHDVRHARTASIAADNPAPSLPQYENVLQVTLMNAHHGVLSQPFLVDLDDEKGLVSLPAIPVDRSIARTG
ncbi:MAG: ImuA family protein, partial [Phycisphaerae bacterium]